MSGVRLGSVEVTAFDQVPAMRERIFGFLARDGVTANRAYDCQVVISELVNNAFEHGGALQVTVDIDSTFDHLVATIRHSDIGVAPDPSAAKMPAPTAARGRGLALALALSSSLTRKLDGFDTLTTAVLDRS